jgi:tetratricopeptide (TPR) repeat protein
MRSSHILPGALLAVLAAGCADLDVTNPSQRTTETFFQNRDDAVQAINATYNGLQQLGAYGRWQTFRDDLRSDIGFSTSPATALANFTKTVLGNYNYAGNNDTWQHNFRTIYRANQVLEHVPDVPFATAEAPLQARILAEAKFIRGVSYLILANFFGGVPLILTSPQVEDRPTRASLAETYAQVEKDLTEAREALPETYTGADVGRATRWAAVAMLGNAYLQQKRWADAERAFGEVIASGRYQLLARYADNFIESGDNNAESVFEVQFTGQAQLAQGSTGYSGPRLYGPCQVGFCDGEARRWYFDQFARERTVTNQIDPRRDATLFHQGSTDVYGRTFVQRYGATNNRIFWKKYTEYYLDNLQNFDNPINFKVVRYAHVLLGRAEALVQLGRPADAVPLVNQIRQRVGLAPYAGAVTQAAMRVEVERQRLLEFGMEADRFLYLKRHDLLNPTLVQPLDGQTLVQHDADFSLFVVGKSELLPIPGSETNFNPNIAQNPNW